MFILIENGDVYSPEPLGRVSVLLSGSTILKIGEVDASPLEMGELDEPIGKAIVEAANEIIEGQWRENFLLDVFQAGAGTSYNMNVNEVIANRALEKLGRRRGDYRVIEPNDHVNEGYRYGEERERSRSRRITELKVWKERIER